MVGWMVASTMPGDDDDELWGALQNLKFRVFQNTFFLPPLSRSHTFIHFVNNRRLSLKTEEEEEKYWLWNMALTALKRFWPLKVRLITSTTKQNKGQKVYDFYPTEKKTQWTHREDIGKQSSGNGWGRFEWYNWKVLCGNGWWIVIGLDCLGTLFTDRLKPASVLTKMAIWRGGGVE